MWLEQFSLMTINVYSGVAVASAVVVALAIILILLPCCSNDRAPGNSLTFFLALSSLFITASVLMRGVHHDWVRDLHSLSTLCQIYIPVTMLGLTMFLLCLIIKLSTFLALYRNPQNLKLDEGGEVREWPLSFTLLIGLIIASAAALLWLICFPPVVGTGIGTGTGTGLNDNSTIIYKCVGRPYNNTGTVIATLSAESRAANYKQLVWKVGTAAMLALLLLISFVESVLACRLRPPLDFRPGLIGYTLIAINTTLSVIAGIVVYFVLDPSQGHKYSRDDPRGRQGRAWLRSLVLSLIEIWIVLFANVTLIIVALLTTDCCDSEDEDESGGVHISWYPPEAVRVEARQDSLRPIASPIVVRAVVNPAAAARRRASSERSADHSRASSLSFADESFPVQSTPLDPTNA